VQGKRQQVSDVAKDLKDIVHRIDPDEVPYLGGPGLTKRQQKTLLRLEQQHDELAKEIRRLERKLDTKERRRLALDARIGELRPPMSGANQVLAEWLVQELNAADHPQEPEGFTVTKP
jgi:predicted  nucleic acid-binding Zn-ribbon protein